MTNLKLEKDVIIKRINGIESEMAELKKLGEQALDKFQSGDSWKLAQFHLHRALEGVFNTGSHIISRIPGASASQYKEIALILGENKIVPLEFAKNELVQMAKYRNRLVHFYAQIEPKELYSIIQNDLPDFKTFLAAIKELLTNPAKYNLEVE